MPPRNLPENVVSLARQMINSQDISPKNIRRAILRRQLVEFRYTFKFQHSIISLFNQYLANQSKITNDKFLSECLIHGKGVPHTLFVLKKILLEINEEYTAPDSLEFITPERLRNKISEIGACLFNADGSPISDFFKEFKEIVSSIKQNLSDILLQLETGEDPHPSTSENPVPEHVKKAFRLACDAWTKASKGRVIFVEDDQSPAIGSRLVSSREFPVGDADGNVYILKIAGKIYYNLYLLEDHFQDPGTFFYTLRVLMHEIGHILGFEHSPSELEQMLLNNQNGLDGCFSTIMSVEERTCKSYIQCRENNGTDFACFDQSFPSRSVKLGPIDEYLVRLVYPSERELFLREHCVAQNPDVWSPFFVPSDYQPPVLELPQSASTSSYAFMLPMLPENLSCPPVNLRETAGDSSNLPG